MAGVAGRSGRKKSVEVLKLQALFDRAWSNRSRIRSIRKLAALAEAGDVAAAKLLLSYAYGKPRLMIQVTGAADGPIQIADATDELKRRLAGLAAAAGAGEDSREPDGD